MRVSRGYPGRSEYPPQGNRIFDPAALRLSRRDASRRREWACGPTATLNWEKAVVSVRSALAWVGRFSIANEARTISIMVSRLFFAAILSAGSVVAAPATRPVTPEADKAKSQIDAIADAVHLPVLPATQPDAIVRFSIVNEMLQLDVLSATPGIFRVASGNPSIVSTVRQTPLRTSAERAIFYVISDFSPPGAMMIQTTVSGGAGPTQVVREYESDRVSGATELLQDPPTVEAQDDAQEPVRLKLERHSDPPEPADFLKKYSARTFAELRRRYPSEVSQYLGSIFRDLHQDANLSLDTAGAWQVVGARFTPDSAAVAEVKSLLPQLGADAFAQRRSAMQSLRAMGEPAALVLMKMDRAGWNTEQWNAVDTFLAAFEPFDTHMIAKLAQDPGYLLSMQYSNDESLRTLAAARLVELLGHPLELDPRSADEARLPIVEQIRKSLPATRPAD